MSPERPNQILVGTYFVNTYRPNCRDTRTDTSFCDDLAQGFGAIMDALGHRWLFHLGNEKPKPDQWRETTDRADGGVDTVQFAYLASHGNTFGPNLANRGYVYYASVAFDTPGDCQLTHPHTTRLKTKSGEYRYVMKDRMALGDGRLRWAVLDSCRGLQVGFVNVDPFIYPEYGEALPSKVWSSAFAGLNMLFGFTGLSSDADWTKYRGLNFGRRAGSGEALADAWVDEASSYWCDDYPVALACGRTVEDADRRLTADDCESPQPSLHPSEIGGFAWLYRK